VFNIASVFANIHTLLRPGGVALHAMPSYGFVNHGFYNVNPNLYVELARSNGYELLDFSYVDNMFVREMQRWARPDEPFDFHALPIRLADMEDTQSFMTKLVWQHFLNVQAADTRRALRPLSPSTDAETWPSPQLHLCFVFDLCFVALRKPDRDA